MSKSILTGFTRLQTLVEAVSLRRTKSDQVNGRPLVALPKKTIRLKRLTFTTEERQIYDAFFAKYRAMVEKYARRGQLLRNYAHVFAMMMRLRQLSCHRELFAGIKWDELDMADIARQAEQGGNSIDIFLSPVSGPEPCPSPFWSFETYLNL